MNWYNNTFRKIHWDFDNSPFLKNIAENFDAEKFITTLKQSKVEAICFFSQDVFGHAYYDSKVLKKHPGLKKNLLKEITGVCHKNDIKVIFYLVAINKNAGIKHPEWRPVFLGEADAPSPTGLPIGGSDLMCLAGPYLEKVVVPQLKELVRLKPDGFFFDIVSQMVNTFCYCVVCQTKFREKFGRDLPKDKGDPFWVEALKWRRSIIDIFEKRVADVIHQANPGILFGSNYAGSIRRPQIPPEYLDYFTLDVTEVLEKEECKGALGSNPLQMSLEARYLSTLNRPFDIMNTRLLYWWGDWMLKPTATLKQECATLLASGGRCFVADKVYHNGTLEKEAMAAIGETFDFIQKREEFCQDARPVPYIGILHSDETMLKSMAANLPEGATALRVWISIQGAHKALVESNFHFNIINEETFLKSGRDYRVIILPEQGLLPEKIKEALRDFVVNGGNLVASHPSPLYEILGIKEVDISPYSFAYLKVIEPGLADRINGLPIMVHAPFVKVKPTSAKSLVRFHAPKWETPGFSYAAPQGSVGDDTGCPGVTIRTLGKGKAIFITGSVFSAYWKKNNPHLKYLIKNLVNLVTPEKIIEVNGPASLEVSLMERGKTKFIHLVNSHTEKNLAGPSFAEEIPVLLDIKVRLKTESVPKSIIQQPENRRLLFRAKRGYIEFTVPRVDIHTVIVVE